MLSWATGCGINLSSRMSMGEEKAVHRGNKMLHYQSTKHMWHLEDSDPHIPVNFRKDLLQNAMSNWWIVVVLGQKEIGCHQQSCDLQHG